MLAALRHRRRLATARRRLAAFVPRDAEQARTRRLLLAMIDSMAVLHCRPGRAGDFEPAWEGVEFLLELLLAPRPPAERPASASAVEGPRS